MTADDLRFNVPHGTIRQIIRMLVAKAVERAMEILMLRDMPLVWRRDWDGSWYLFQGTRAVLHDK